MPFLGIDIIPVAITIFWIWMLIDCITNKKLRGGSKVLWLLVIFFTHIFGALIYFFMECKQRNPVSAFTYYYHQISTFMKQSAAQPAPPPQAYPYREYQQGYQAQQPPEQPVQPVQYQQQEPPLYTPPRAEYDEQLTISYPEMPQQKE